MITKVCTICLQEKEESLFLKRQRGKEGCINKCRSCVSKQRKDKYAEDNQQRKQKNQEWVNKNKDKVQKQKQKWAASNQRQHNLKIKYNLSLEEFQELYIRDLGKCRICNCTLTMEKIEGIKVAHIDHNHTTGKIRGILCGSCNTALGLFKDSPTILEKASQYLIKESSEND